MNHWQWMGAALVTSACLGAAQAAEFDVGRATVVFGTGDWSVADLTDEGAKYGGDRSGVIPSEMKLFIKTAPQGDVEAVAVVRASRHGVPAVYMTYRRSCDPTDKVFAEGNTGDALRFASCLRVHPSYTTKSLLEHLGEPGRAVLEAHTGRLPEGMHEITSNFANSNGTFVETYVWLAPGFEGSPGTVNEALPKDVPASHVAWGRALNNAVRGSVTSIFGTLKFPAVSFNASPSGSSASRIALQTSPGN